MWIISSPPSASIVLVYAISFGQSSSQEGTPDGH